MEYRTRYFGQEKSASNNNNNKKGKDKINKVRSQFGNMYQKV